MDKINKNGIERIKVNDKWHLPHYMYHPRVYRSCMRKGKPETWNVPFLHHQTRAEIKKEGLLLIIDNKIYTKPNVRITLFSGDKIIHRFDTNKEAHNYAHEYIKKNDIKGLINSI